MIGVGFGIGFVFGLVFGGMFVEFGICVLFFVVVVFVGVNVIFGYFVLKEIVIDEICCFFCWKCVNLFGVFVVVFKFLNFGVFFVVFFFY